MPMTDLFRQEQQQLLEKYSKNTRSQIPVDILTNYVVQQIEAFDIAVEQGIHGVQAEQFAGQSSQRQQGNSGRRD